MSLAQGDHLADESEKPGVPLFQGPVDPARIVVLAPGVVVAHLGAEKLVSSQNHGNSLGKKQRRHQIVYLALAQAVDLRVGGGSFDAAVPAPIGVVAVAVSFAVGFVVLLVVR